MIRSATTDDLPALVEIGALMMAEHPASFDAPGVLRAEIGGVLGELIETGQCVRVAEAGGVVKGGFVGILSGVWYAPSIKVAVQLVWWVDPSVRASGLGVQLLADFERWASSVGASYVVMADLVSKDGVPAMNGMVERLGYQTVERSHFKKI